MGSPERKKRRVKDGGSNIRVVVRARPLSTLEKQSDAPVILRCDPERKEVHVSSSARGKAIQKKFSYDAVFGQFDGQASVYAEAVEPIVDDVLEGFACTIFAYGQTGTGKTHTMQGDAKDPVNKGIVPRAVETMFKRLERQKKENTIKVSCLQIYNEELQDLLDDESELTAHGGSVSVSKPLKIFEERGGKGGVSIPNLVEEIVTSADDIFKIIEKSNQKRISAATLLNKNSSRSHCIFTVTIHSKEVSVDGEQTIKTGKLNLVDLAGSECVGKSGAMEERAKETGNINKSLLTLGRVINKLVEGQTHIPYRDSKLTRLLQESLGGRAKTVIIATVSPSLICMDETLNTLEYASRAKNILNKPEVNEVKTQKAFVKELNSHILDLQAQLEVARSKNGIYLSEEHFVRMQTDLESQRLLLKEYEQELQSRAKELDQMSELLQQQKTKTEEQYKINEGLRSENASLKKSLDTSIARNGELEYLIQHLRTIETRLNSEAEETRTNLLSSIKECDMLREKITRYEEMDLNNSSRVNATVDEVGKICSNLQSHMIDIGTHFRNTENVLRSKIEGYSESQRAVLQHLKEDLSLVSSSQKELASQISTIIVQHKEATTENDEALSKCLSMQTEKVHESMVASSEHFTSCFERLNGALTKIIENISSMKTSLVDSVLKSRESIQKECDSINSSLSDLLSDLNVIRSSNEQSLKSFMTESRESREHLAMKTRQKLEDMLTVLKSCVEDVCGLHSGFLESALEHDSSFSKTVDTSSENAIRIARKAENAITTQTRSIYDQLSSYNHLLNHSLEQQSSAVHELEQATKEETKHLFSDGSLALSNLKTSSSQFLEKGTNLIAEDRKKTAAQLDAMKTSVEKCLKMEDNRTILFSNYVSFVQENDSKSRNEISQVLESSSKDLGQLATLHTQAVDRTRTTITSFHEDFASYVSTGTTPARRDVEVISTFSRAKSEQEILKGYGATSEGDKENTAASVPKSNSLVNVTPRKPRRGH